ncbi:MAG TPA: hypothetical protein VOA78_05760 [Candidatus Dormibacteraeota bacterium]|nr:hypothetical protein [Candidatus Dormibacteraeota bacterium]
MKPKEIFWSGLKGGLFEAKHRKAMGEAVWLFGWLCMRQSQINESGEGLPHYGNPLTFAEIADDTGFPISTLRKWSDRLGRTGYIHTQRVGNLGLIFFIHKAKSKAKNPKPHTRYFPAELQPNGDYRRMSAKMTDKVTASQVRPNLDGPGEQVRPNLDGVPPKNGRTYANNCIENQIDTPTSNTLTPKHLLNYNTQASVSSLLRKTARKLQPPRRMSQASLDERRRLLLRQSEEMQRKYPPKEQPGQVIAIRKEATA